MLESVVFKNGPTPASFSFFLFLVFSNKQYNLYKKSMWKNVHLVYGAGIRTHNLSKIINARVPAQALVVS